VSFLHPPPPPPFTCALTSLLCGHRLSHDVGHVCRAIAEDSTPLKLLSLVGSRTVLHLALHMSLEMQALTEPAAIAVSACIAEGYLQRVTKGPGGGKVHPGQYLMRCITRQEAFDPQALCPRGLVSGEANESKFEFLERLLKGVFNVVVRQTDRGPEDLQRRCHAAMEAIKRGASTRRAAFLAYLRSKYGGDGGDTMWAARVAQIRQSYSGARALMTMESRTGGKVLQALQAEDAPRIRLAVKPNQLLQYRRDSQREMCSIRTDVEFCTT
jgi:hypothetical protein